MCTVTGSWVSWTSGRCGHTSCKSCRGLKQWCRRCRGFPPRLLPLTATGMETLDRRPRLPLLWYAALPDLLELAILSRKFGMFRITEPTNSLLMVLLGIVRSKSPPFRSHVPDFTTRTTALPLLVCYLSSGVFGSVSQLGLYTSDRFDRLQHVALSWEAISALLSQLFLCQLCSSTQVSGFFANTAPGLPSDHIIVAPANSKQGTSPYSQHRGSLVRTAPRLTSAHCIKASFLPQHHGLYIKYLCAFLRWSTCQFSSGFCRAAFQLGVSGGGAGQCVPLSDRGQVWRGSGALHLHPARGAAAGGRNPQGYR